MVGSFSIFNTSAHTHATRLEAMVSLASQQCVSLHFAIVANEPSMQFIDGHFQLLHRCQTTRCWWHSMGSKGGGEWGASKQPLQTKRFFTRINYMNELVALSVVYHSRLLLMASQATVTAPYRCLVASGPRHVKSNRIRSCRSREWPSQNMRTHSKSIHSRLGCSISQNRPSWRVWRCIRQPHHVTSSICAMQRNPKRKLPTTMLTKVKEKKTKKKNIEQT